MHQSQPSLHSLRINFTGAPRTLTWQSLDLVQCHLEAPFSQLVESLTFMRDRTEIDPRQCANFVICFFLGKGIGFLAVVLFVCNK